jgi:hypothetical protein
MQTTKRLDIRGILHEGPAEGEARCECRPPIVAEVFAMAYCKHCVTGIGRTRQLRETPI